MAGVEFSIGTDVAHLLLFHPDDLEHRESDPIAWYSYDFAYRRESAAGRLIAWGTGSDGGFSVRLTTDGLTGMERPLVCASWTFPLVVRHGRVVLDNTDGLPADQARYRSDEIPDGWYEIANGSYRVTVHPIDRWAQPGGSVPSLPDYVVVFEPVASILDIPVADAPPQLRQQLDWTPPPPRGLEAEGRFLWPTRAIEEDRLPILVVGQDQAVLPRKAISFSMSEEIDHRFFPPEREVFSAIETCLLATSARPGALGVAARVSGRSQFSGERPRLKCQGIGIVRIAEDQAGATVDEKRIVPVAKPDMVADPARLEVLRVHLLAAAKPSSHVPDARLAASSFDLEQLQALPSAEAVTTWALEHLLVGFDRAVALYGSSARERIDGIEAYLLDAG